MLSTILPLTLTLILTLLHTTLTTALTTNFTLLNLTHIPTSATAPHIHNGSISFVLLATTDYSTHYCSRTFITPNELDASGGPFACNDEWQDLLFYWRKGSSAPANGTDDAGVVELDIWFAYLDCRSVLRIISPGKKNNQLTKPAVPRPAAPSPNPARWRSRLPAA